MRALLFALKSVTLFEPFSPLRLSRGCNGFCNQESSRKKKRQTTTKVKTKPNNSYDGQFAICACFTAVCTQLHVLFVVPWPLPVHPGIPLGLNMFVLVGLF